jgi:hypothetical protein
MLTMINEKLKLFFNSIKKPIWIRFGIEMTEESNRFVLLLLISFIVIILTVIFGQCKGNY